MKKFLVLIAVLISLNLKRPDKYHRKILLTLRKLYDMALLQRVKLCLAGPSFQ